MYRPVNNVAGGSVMRSRLVDMLLRGRGNQNNGTIAGGLAHSLDSLTRGLHANRQMQAAEAEQQQETDATNAMVRGMSAQQWQPPEDEQVFRGDAPNNPPLPRAEHLARAAPAGGYDGAISAVQGLGTPAGGRLASKLMMTKAERDMQLADRNAELLQVYDPDTGSMVYKPRGEVGSGSMSAAPAAKFETVQNPFGRGGVGQRNTATGQVVGYQAPTTPDRPKAIGDPIEVMGPDGKPGLMQRFSDGSSRPVSLGEGYSMAPPSAFSGTSMDAQANNILLSGDPSSPQYAAAYRHLAQPKTQFDPQSGQMVSIQPDMSNFRPPASMGQGGPAMASGGAPGQMGQPMPAGQPGQMPGGQPGGSQVSISQVADPQNVKVSGETAGRVGLAMDAMRTITPDVVEFVRQGGLTGPVDYATGVVAGRGRAGEVYREIMAGSEALTRMLTGAGMNMAEAQREAQQYLPQMTDNGEVAANKLVQLRRRLGSVVEVAREGLPRNPDMGQPGASSQPVAYPDHSQFTDEQLLSAPVGTTVMGPDGQPRRKNPNGKWGRVGSDQQDANFARQSSQPLGAR